MLLTFQNLIVSELTAENALVILARGLGAATALATLVARVASPSSLVIAINVSRPTAYSVIFPEVLRALRTPDPFREGGPPPDPLLFLPRFINADYSVRDRTDVYQEGGFLVVTGQILTHDLLHRTLKPEKVKCLVVWAADSLKEGSSEHFALKLLRIGNKTVGLKAFSENPSAFARGFHSAERTLRLLRISRLSLFPRFHTEVQSVLAEHAPELVDLSITPSSKVEAIVAALREAAKSTVAELRLCSKTIDFSDVFTRDRKRLVPNFDQVINRQIRDGGGERRLEFSRRALQLAEDLSSLHDVIRDALTLNAVAFYRRCMTLRHTNPSRSGWLIRREAQRALGIARSRVYIRRKKARPNNGKTLEAFLRKSSDSKVSDSGQRNGQSGDTGEASVPKEETETEVVVPVLEPSPKWKVLEDVLSEVEPANVRRVLVVTREKRNVEELRQVLTLGSKKYLMKQFLRVFGSLKDSVPQKNDTNRKERKVMTEPTDEVVTIPEDEQLEDGQRLAECEQFFGEVGRSEMSVIIWGLERVDGEGRMKRILGELCPEVIVMYDYDMCFIRQVEVYKAENPGTPLRIYLLIYQDDCEESLVHVSAEREKSAFKTLIRHRASMIIHVDEDDDEMEVQERANWVESGYEATRAGEQQVVPKRYQGADWDLQLPSSLARSSRRRKVIVDTRELRGSIPMTLFSRGIEIVPVTLEVGDFILTPRIGVERKTVPDLYGSFTSGRLFNQAEALSRHYLHPCLLIEFASDKKLSLLATEPSGTSSELRTNSIIAKLVLLIRQFPTLRLLWARGPREAAELFEAVKGSAEEPVAEEAVKLGVDSTEDGEDTYNAGPRAFLRSLPGIDGKNIFAVMRKVKNVAELLNMDQAQMIETLGSQKNGRLLFEFVNEQPPEAIGAL